MTTIFHNADLAPTNTGFETCVAAADNVVFYTGNWFAAYSTDGGDTFDAVSPYKMMELIPGQTFCCDQRTEYIPQIDTLVWVLQSKQGTIMLAVASPGDIASSKGRGWWYYNLSPSIFRLGADRFDFSQISYGNKYLYFTANRTNASGAILARFPLDLIEQRATLVGQFYKIDIPFICPCHNTLDVGWFGALESDSEVRVYSWEEDPAAFRSPPSTIAIATVPNTDFSSLTPDGDDWLPPTSKIQSIVTGAARTRDRLYLAWSAGRKFANGEASPIPQPHIEYVAIDMAQKVVEVQRYIWNRDFAFAWPSLAGNWGWQIQDHKIALSFCFGGGDRYPQHAVGILGEPPNLATTSGRTAGAGGHYNDARMYFPDTSRFIAAGFATAKDNSTPPTTVHHPHYVIFGS
jgi:hypothetical protein